jgi:hypothetical protein
MKRHFIIAVFSICALAAGAYSQSEDEYQVYSTVLREMFVGDKVTFDTQSKVKQLVILNLTNTNYASSENKENWQQVRLRLPALSDETLADFESKLKNASELKRSFKIDLQYSLINKQQLDEAFTGGEDAWTSFYKKFPDSGGYVSLSNVGFNNARDQALVYFVHWCGSLCGTGHYIPLRKKENSWSVLEKGMIWIS